MRPSVRGSKGIAGAYADGPREVHRGSRILRSCNEVQGGSREEYGGSLRITHFGARPARSMPGDGAGTAEKDRCDAEAASVRARQASVRGWRLTCTSRCGKGIVMPFAANAVSIAVFNSERTRRRNVMSGDGSQQ